MFPKFAVLNPRFTYSLPKSQMTAGFFDIMSHILEQYFSGEDDNTSDYNRCNTWNDISSYILPYYRYIMKDGFLKFRRYAINVWNVNQEGKTAEEVAKEGLDAMEDYMKEIGVVMNLAELEVTENMIPGIVKATLIMDGGYKVLNAADIEAILKQSI